MKKIAVVAGLAVLSTSAFATKARMQALGQDQALGSFFMRDSRSVFRNASHIVDNKDYIVMEWGVDSGATDTDNSAPRAEGGFFKEAGSFTYGVYLGHQNIDDLTSTAVDTTANGVADREFLGDDNRIDLFFGGDAGVQWGVNLYYSNVRDELGDDLVVGSGGAAAVASQGDGANYRHAGLNLGVTMGNIEGYLNMEIIEDASGSVNNPGAGTASTSIDVHDEYEGDFAFTLGGSYAMNDYTIYVEYEQDGSEYHDALDAAIITTSDHTSFTYGVAKMMEVSEKSRWFWDVALSFNNVETILDNNPAITTAETDTDDLKVTVGFESDVKSWLTLRGSIAQSAIFSTQSLNVRTDATDVDNDDDNLNSTNVNTGATLRFGDVSLDGILGYRNNGGTENGQLRSDEILSRVAFVYNF